MFDSCHNGNDKHTLDIGEVVGLDNRAQSKSKRDSAVSRKRDALELTELFSLTDEPRDFETSVRKAYDVMRVRLESFDVRDESEELFRALKDAAKALMRVLEIDEEAQSYE